MSPSEAASEVLARLAAPGQGLAYVVGIRFETHLDIDLDLVDTNLFDR